MCDCFYKLAKTTEEFENKPCELETTAIQSRGHIFLVPALYYSVKTRRMYSDKTASERRSIQPRYCPLCGEKWIPEEK